MSKREKLEAVYGHICEGWSYIREGKDSDGTYMPGVPVRLARQPQAEWENRCATCVLGAQLVADFAKELGAHSAEVRKHPLAGSYGYGADHVYAVVTFEEGGGEYGYSLQGYGRTYVDCTVVGPDLGQQIDLSAY